MPTLNVNPLTIVVQTATQWSVDATVYNERQILVTSDEVYTPYNFRKIKLGNGTQAWSALSYLPIDVILTLGISLQAQINNISASLVFGTAAGTFCEGNDSRLSDARVRKMLAYDNTTHSHTGDTSQTILIGNLEIPAGTLGANDGFMFECLIGGAGTAGTKTFRLYIGTTANTLVGATLIGTNQLNATAIAGGFRRILMNKNNVALNESYPATQSAATDTAASNVAITTVNYNFANTAYLILTVQNANSGDTGSVRNAQVFKSST